MNLTDWCKANQLSVNPSKTKYIIFSRNVQSMQFIPEMFLQIDNENLEGLIQHKSWGFTLIYTLHGKIILSIVVQNYQTVYMLYIYVKAFFE